MLDHLGGEDPVIRLCWSALDIRQAVVQNRRQALALALGDHAFVAIDPDRGNAVVAQQPEKLAATAADVQNVRLLGEIPHVALLPTPDLFLAAPKTICEVQIVKLDLTEWRNRTICAARTAESASEHGDPQLRSLELAPQLGAELSRLALSPLECLDSSFRTREHRAISLRQMLQDGQLGCQRLEQSRDGAVELCLAVKDLKHQPTQSPPEEDTQPADGRAPACETKPDQVSAAAKRLERAAQAVGALARRRLQTRDLRQSIGDLIGTSRVERCADVVREGLNAAFRRPASFGRKRSTMARHRLRDHVIQACECIPTPGLEVDIEHDATLSLERRHDLCLRQHIRLHPRLNRELSGLQLSVLQRDCDRHSHSRRVGKLRSGQMSAWDIEE